MTTPELELRTDPAAQGPGSPVRPRFYDLHTADGVPYEQIARLHGSDVLAATTVKSASDLAEVADAAVRLDGVRQMVMTTGTTPGRDLGAVHLARCVRAVTAAVPGLPVKVQIEPPEDLTSITALRRAGAAAIGIHVESLDDEVRARWMPGKATVPLSRYWQAWDEAVRVFGRNRVSTYLLVGLGEHPAELLADVTARVADLLAAAGMPGADQQAACGACSALAVAGG